MEPAFTEHPYYTDPEVLCVTDADGEVTRTLPCERQLLEGPQAWPSHHIGAHLGRCSDGCHHALVAGGAQVWLYASSDQGVTWRSRPAGLPSGGGFTVLADDRFLAVTGGGAESIRVLESVDAGNSWAVIAELDPFPFPAAYVDSNLLVLRDGTLRLAIHHRFSEPEGAPMAVNTSMQYVHRSDDGGHTWGGGPDRELWRRFGEGALTAADEALLHDAGFDLRRKHGVLVAEDRGPQARWPGEGGTYPGRWETGLLEQASGRLMAAFRMSGFPRPWHFDYADAWGAGEPDGHGRIFRHVMLGRSDDGGRTWSPLWPVLDAHDRPLLVFGECNGELAELSDGRLVLVHQTRYPRGRSQLSAKVSDDGGQTWRPETWRITYGFGYSATLALEDDTLLTVTGASLGDNGYPRRVAAIRWRVD